METNTQAENVEIGDISDLLGGKGAERTENIGKEPFKCRHRWALVSRNAIKDKLSPKGTLFVQCCRWCGTFRASSFWPREDKGRIELIWRVHYLKAVEGLNTVVFDPHEAKLDDEISE